MAKMSYFAVCCVLFILVTGVYSDTCTDWEDISGIPQTLICPDDINLPSNTYCCAPSSTNTYCCDESTYDSIDQWNDFAENAAGLASTILIAIICSVVGIIVLIVVCIVICCCCCVGAAAAGAKGGATTTTVIQPNAVQPAPMYNQPPPTYAAQPMAQPAPQPVYDAQPV